MYVNAGISASGDGSGWSTAYKTLKEALDFANTCSLIDSIKVASGTYYPTGLQNGTDRDAAFFINRGGLKIIGGYNAATGLRNINANATVLSGAINTAADTDNSYHIIAIAGIDNAADSIVVDGFVFTKGYASGTTDSVSYTHLTLPTKRIV